MDTFKSLITKYSFYKKLEFFSKHYKECTGSCSKIFLLKERSNDKLVLCKRINYKNYFHGEHDFPKKINTDRVIKILNTYKDDFGYYYIVMEFNKEKELFNYVCDKKFDETSLKPIIKEMALCIKDCHDNGIVHLDIKCENFIITNKDPLKLKLIDFGHSQLSKNNTLMKKVGTLQYCSPEVFNGKYYKSSDIYSLGVIIKFLIPYKLFSKDLGKLVLKMTDIDHKKRPSIEDVINSPWLKS